jgi:cephalosporin hydroxylase
MSDVLPPGLDLKALTPAQLHELVRLANVLYFRSAAWDRATWLGHQVVKCPTDLWVYQELIHAVRPDVLVETGTWVGGSALYFTQLMELIGHGEVISVDLVDRLDRPTHPRLRQVLGDSIDPTTVEQVRTIVGGRRAMVILDAAHGADHVLAELHAYAPLVSEGSYLIVEDTAFDAWPAWPEWGPGPAAAVATFLQTSEDFEVDHDAGRHLLTLAPGGFLRRGKR